MCLPTWQPFWFWALRKSSDLAHTVTLHCSGESTKAWIDRLCWFPPCSWLLPIFGFQADMMETHKHSLCHEQPTVTASSDQGSCDLVQQSRCLARDTFSTHISLRKRNAVPSQKASYQYGTLVAAPAKIGVLSLPWAMDHDPWSPELPNGWQIKAAKPRMMSVSKKSGALATTDLGSFQWEAPQLELLRASSDASFCGTQVRPVDFLFVDRRWFRSPWDTKLG